MQDILDDLSYKNLVAKLDPLEFQRLRKKNLPKYRQNVKRFLSVGDKKYLLKVEYIYPQQIAEFILKNPSSSRLEEEIQLLQKATEDFQFFQQLNAKRRNVERKLHYLCCQKMSYRYFKQGEIIFKFDDPPDQFFIILDGIVNIFLPINVDKLKNEVIRSKLEYAKLNQQERLNHPIGLIQRAKKHHIKQKLALPYQIIQMLNWKRGGKPKLNNDLQNGQEEESSIQSARDSTQSKHSEFKKSDEYTHPVESIRMSVQQMSSQPDLIRDSQIDEEIPSLDNSRDYDNNDIKTIFEQSDAGKSMIESTGGISPLLLNSIDYFFNEGVLQFQLVAQISSGMMFGELGILMNKPRSATIVAKTTTHVAVMRSEDYKQILQEAEFWIMDQRVKFFMDNFFQSIPKNVVIKYSYNFKKIKLQRGSHLYLEGDDADVVYLIKKGDLQIYKKYQFKVGDNQKLVRLTNAKNANQLVKLVDEDPSNLVKIVPQTITLNICNLNTGQIVGESDIIQKTQRKNSVIVTSDQVTLYSLNANQFLKMLSDNLSLKKNFLESIQLKQNWENQKFLEMQAFQQMNHNRIMVSKADAQSKMQNREPQLVQKKFFNIYSRKKSMEMFNQRQSILKPADFIDYNDRDVDDLQRNSTKNIVGKLQSQVKIESKILGVSRGNIDFLELSKLFQNDLMELQYVRRQQQNLSPYKELEKQKLYRLNLSQNKIITTANQNTRDQIINKQQTDFRYQSPVKKHNQTTYDLNEQTQGSIQSIDQFDKGEKLYDLNLFTKQNLLNQKQQQLLKQMNFVSNYSTYQKESDGFQIKSYLEVRLSIYKKLNRLKKQLQKLELMVHHCTQKKTILLII